MNQMHKQLITVLIVEDNPGDVDLIKALFAQVRTPKFQVEAAEDLNSAIARLYHQPFDVVLLDLCLPDSNGLDTLKDLQNHHPDLPIVVLTGLADEDFAVDIVRQGAQDYLVKGQITPDLLVRSLRYAIERSLSEQKLRQTQQALHQANQELERRVQEQTQAVSLRDQLLNEFFNAASNANVGLAIQDKTLKFKQINQALAEINGLSVDEHLGKTTEDILPHLAPTITPIIHQVITTGKPLINQEITGETANKPGVTRYWLASYFPVFSKKNTVDEIGSLVVEITALKQAQQKLQDANRELTSSNQELEQFAYIASHDLREPLRKIKGYTELLAEDYQGQLDEMADKYIHYITDGVTRLETLIKDLLTYSRVGRDNREIRSTDLNTVLAQTLDDLSLCIDENHAQIIADPLPTVAANSRQMGQLFQNLISNAIKFRRDIPPQIHISAESQKDSWLIQVSDNGIGIKPQYTDRIFEIFQRLHSRSKYPGTGIGLAIVRKIVECQGGKIWLESEFNQGTTFYFTLRKKVT